MLLKGFRTNSEGYLHALTKEKPQFHPIPISVRSSTVSHFQGSFQSLSAFSPIYLSSSGVILAGHEDWHQRSTPLHGLGPLAAVLGALAALGATFAPFFGNEAAAEGGETVHRTN